MFGFIKKLIGSSDKKDETNYQEKYVEVVNAELKFEMDTVTDSKNKIDELQKLCDLVKYTKYHEKFKEVLDITSKIHNKYINENLPKIKLAQFHIYYTNTFISTYTELTKSLRVEDIKAVKQVVSNEPIIKYTHAAIEEKTLEQIIALYVEKLGLKKIIIPKNLNKMDDSARMTNGQKFLQHCVLRDNVSSGNKLYYKIREGVFVGESDKYAVVYCNNYTDKKLFFINQSAKDDVYIMDFHKNDIYDFLNDITKSSNKLSDYKYETSR